MDSSIYIQLIFLCAINIFFTFCGTILNLIVIFSLWKSSQRREKLCYFMIIVLSCVDLLAVVTNHPIIVIFSIFWLIDRYDLLARFMICIHISAVFLGFSLLTLLVMNFDRYLATMHPFFHRVSVTRGRLLAVIAILCFFQIFVVAISVNDILISSQIILTCFLAIVSPPFFFVNYKLYMISRRMRKNKATSPKITSIVKLKNISCCLLAVFCFVLFSIPTYMYIVLSITGKSKLSDIRLSALWAKSIVTMNSTFNCLIFYWKNKLLRVEGMRLIQSFTSSGHYQ